MKSRALPFCWLHVTLGIRLGDYSPSWEGFSQSKDLLSETFRTQVVLGTNESLPHSFLMGIQTLALRTQNPVVLPASLIDSPSRQTRAYPHIRTHPEQLEM